MAESLVPEFSGPDVLAQLAGVGDACVFVSGQVPHDGTNVVCCWGRTPEAFIVGQVVSGGHQTEVNFGQTVGDKFNGIHERLRRPPA